MNPILMSFFSLQPKDRFGKTIVSLAARNVLDSQYSKITKHAVAVAEQRFKMALADASKKLRGLRQISRDRK
ncbi:hypothetical protein HYV71_03585 [Candidatus Uhrbacteria bacterium]|nr:hypothetical protein [Candidatus Uhrbacteria bacterium]